MEKTTRIIMLISFIACIICLGMGIYMSVVLRDTFSYAVAVLFFCATIWMGMNILKNRKSKQE